MSCELCGRDHEPGAPCIESGRVEEEAPGMTPEPELPVEDGTVAPEAIEAPTGTLPGLLTTEDEFGFVKLPGDVPPGGFDECPRCTTPVTDSEFCTRCGAVVKPIPRERLERSEVPLACLKCGMPNPRSRALCLGCGERL